MTAAQANVVQNESISVNGVTLFLDQNARLIDGKVFVPNSLAKIKNDVVFVPAPTALHDMTTDSYFLPNELDPNNPTLLDEVLVDSSGQVFARAAEFTILEDTDGAAVPYTLDVNAQVTDQGQIYTLTGTQPLPKVQVVAT